MSDTGRRTGIGLVLIGGLFIAAVVLLFVFVPIRPGPRLIIDTPSADQEISIELRLSGTVRAATARREAFGREGRLRWSIPEIDVSGEITYAGAERFDFTVPLGGYLGGLTVQFIAEERRRRFSELELAVTVTEPPSAAKPEIAVLTKTEDPVDEAPPKRAEAQPGRIEVVRDTEEPTEELSFPFVLGHPIELNRAEKTALLDDVDDAPDIEPSPWPFVLGRPLSDVLAEERERRRQVPAPSAPVEPEVEIHVPAPAPPAVVAAPVEALPVVPEPAAIEPVEPESVAPKPTEPDYPVVPELPEPAPIVLALPPPPEDPPEAAGLTIDTPKNGDHYLSFITVSGRVVGIEDPSWRAEALDAGGRVSADPDGNFLFDISAIGHREVIDLVITGTMRDGTAVEKTRRVVNDGIGPSLGVDQPLEGGFYVDDLRISGVVGPGPEDPPGIGEVGEVIWSWAGADTKPRPVFFDPEGRYDFDVDVSDLTGPQALVIDAKDLNGNITRKVVRVRDGRLPPEITLRAPAEGTVYGAGILLEGRIRDPYAGDAGFGGIDEVRYQIRPLSGESTGIREGLVNLDAAGEFRFSLYSDGLQGRQSVTVTAAGRNGKSAFAVTEIDQGRSAIPSFAVESSDGAVRAHWEPLTMATGYELRVIDPNEAITRYTVATPPVEITPLRNGELYRFILEAETPRGFYPSHEVSTIPMAGATLQPEVLGDYRRIRVIWSPIPGASSYRVYRSIDPEGPYQARGDPITEPEYTDTAVDFGRRYWYAVAPEGYPDLLSDPTPGESRAAQERKLEEIARLEAEVVRDLEVVGEYAYAAADDALKIFDISETSRPTVTGVLPIPGARGVAVDGAYAYVVAGDEGLKIINVDDPSRPLAVGSRKAGHAVAVDVAAGYAYVADEDRGLRVLDVSDPRAPQRIALLDGIPARDLVVRGDIVYVAAGIAGLAVVDVGIPAVPRSASSVSFPGAATLDVREDRLVMAGPEGGVAVVDIADPEQPRVISRLPDVSATHLANYGDYVFTAGSGSVEVIDLRDPGNPLLFATAESEEPLALALARRGDDLLVATPAGLRVVKTFLTGASYVTGGVATPGRAYGITLDGNRLYISDHHGGVSVAELDESDPTIDPRPVGRADTQFAEGTAVIGSTLLVADGPGGLKAFRFEGTDLIPLESFGTPGRFVGVVSSGTAAAAVSPDSGVFFFDPDADGGPPTVVGNDPFPGSFAVAEEGGRFYVANPAEGIRIYADLSGEPAVRIPHPGVRAVALAEGLLAAVDDDGMTIYDIADPDLPVLLAVFEAPQIEGIHLRGRLAYLSRGFRGLDVVNLRYPSRPDLVSTCREVFALEAQATGDRVYVADGEDVRVVTVYIPSWLR